MDESPKRSAKREKLDSEDHTSGEPRAGGSTDTGMKQARAGVGVRQTARGTREPCLMGTCYRGSVRAVAQLHQFPKNP